MTDADLTARFNGIDARLDAIDARLERLAAAMEARDTYLESLDAQVGRLVTAAGRHTEMLMRGFTWRDEEMQEIRARLEALEERLPPEGSR